MILPQKIPRHLHGAIHIILSTTLDLDLNRRMSDTKVVTQFFVHRPQHLLTASDTLFRNHNVTTTADHAGAYHPDVQIVNRQDAMHFSDRLLQLHHAQARRYTFEQHIDTLFEDAPRTPEDECGGQK